MSTFRAAVIQDATIQGNASAATQAACALIAQAADLGASIAVLPEAFIGGYPKGEDFGVKVGSRTPEGREAFARYAAGAIEVPGAETEMLGEAARRHRMQVVIGVIEQAGGTLYCTALGFDHTGALRGRHRKVMPTAAERLIWGFGDGSTLDVWPTPLGRVGTVICWENYMPLLRTAMYAQDVQLYCAPTVDDRDTWLPSMRHIAIEGRCFVLSACAFQPAEDPRQRIRGGSCIIGPLGEVLAGPVFDEKTILTAEIDTSRITGAKFDLDTTGHYARPDLFQLRVNTQVLQPAILNAENAGSPPP
jgi:nitrilase